MPDERQLTISIYPCTLDAMVAAQILPDNATLDDVTAEDVERFLCLIHILADKIPEFTEKASQIYVGAKSEELPREILDNRVRTFNDLLLG